VAEALATATKLVIDARGIQRTMPPRAPGAESG